MILDLNEASQAFVLLHARVCVCLCVYEHFGGRGGLRRMLRAGSGLGGGSREMRPF